MMIADAVNAVVCAHLPAPPAEWELLEYLERLLSSSSAIVLASLEQHAGADRETLCAALLGQQARALTDSRRIVAELEARR